MLPLDQHGPIAISSHFSDLTEKTAPVAAAPLLAQAREIFGFVPNLAVVMAAEPATLESYFHSLQTFARTALSPIEQQVVLMTVSHANRADYSLAIHAASATKLGAAPEVVRAVARGRPVADARIEALRRFTERLTVTRGHVTADEVGAFLASGYDRRAIIAVAFGVAVKTFANSLALVAGTPVDPAFAPVLERVREPAA